MIELLSKVQNKLLCRQELLLKIHHVGERTPSFNEIKEKVASEFNLNLDLTYIISIKTKAGRNESIVELHVYDSKEAADALVPSYIKKRQERKAKGKE